MVYFELFINLELTDADNEGYDEATCGPKRSYKLKLYDRNEERLSARPQSMSHQEE
jgi:hypothetical protein